FMKEITICETLYDSIICWILMEYYDYTKERLNDIKNFEQSNQNTIDYQFFMNTNISLSNLNNLIITLKDNNYNNNNEIIINQQSFEFLLDMIKKWCYNIKHIKIMNLLIFDNKRIPKIQEIVNQQKNLLKLELFTSSNQNNENIIINNTLKSLRDNNNKFLTEIEIHDIDFSDISILEGLISVNSLKSLLLSRCFYLPKTLKYLGLIGLFNYNMNHLENLLSNCNIDLESLEIYGSINYNILTIILNQIMKNKNIKSLIIDNNLNCKDWNEPELSLLNDISKLVIMVIR
ncbi:5263_t:CDS:2, partial [Rhizophagus irregularis]